MFTAKLCEKFKKDLKKNDFDSIEKTRITQKQIDHLIEMLETKNTKAKGYYYYRKQYEVKNDLFKLGCSAGVLDTFVACNCIEKTNLVTEFNQEFIPKDKQGDFIKVSARE
ncbi:hypothetical protein BpHYR1_042585, partial [Brachionus plicatilis]